MQADSIFVKGYSHPVCQDYAKHGCTDDGVHYAIISDGCSSSENTDIGARVLTLEAERIIHILGVNAIAEPPRKLCNYIVENALEAIHKYKLSVHCLDATLGIVMMIKNIKAIAILYGDGGIFVKNKVIPSDVFNVEFKDNYPMYPVYIKNKNLLLPETNEKVLTICDLNSSEVRVTRNYSSEESINHPYFDIIRTQDKDDVVDDYNEMEFIGVFSDGVCSFQKNTQSVSSVEVVKNLTSYKQFKGSFAQRRVNAFLKECKKNETDHYDDLSIGVIYTGE